MIIGTAGAPLYSDDLYNGDNGLWTPVRVYHESQDQYGLVEIDG
jgi:hypothetical protein